MNNSLISRWVYKKFNELTPYELYDLLRLRSEVFVVEQTCIFLDQDNVDQHCFHLLGYGEDKLLAYSRIVPPGIVYKEPSIGRVVSSAYVRGQGVGKELIQQSLLHLYQTFGNVPVKIGAQLYLKKFYESFGFEQSSDVYLEDGIEHIYMIKKVSS